MSVSRTHGRSAWIAVLAAVLACQLIPVLAGLNPAPSGLAGGADSYMRLERVRHLHEADNWYDALDPSTNAPYGERLQWSRPLDALLYAGAWVGSAAASFDTALYWWSLAIAPLMMLAVIPLWTVGTRTLLAGEGVLLSFVILMVMPRLSVAFWFGNADHHGLLALLFIAVLCVFFQVVLGRWGKRAALAAGALSGIALWVSVEALVSTVLVGAGLAFLWLWRGGQHDRLVSHYLAGVLLAITIALPIERPPREWLAPFFERISIVHWAMAAVMTLSWYLAAAICRNGFHNPTPRHRAATIAVAGLVTGLFMAAAYPKFFLGPFVAYDSEVFRWWVDRVAEYQPLWPTDRVRLARLLVNLTPAILSSVYVAWRWRTADESTRNVFAFVLLGFLVFVPLALMHYRWVIYVQVLAVLPLAMAASAVRQWTGGIAIFRHWIPLRLPAVAVLISAPLLLGIVAYPSSRAPALNSPCDSVTVSKYLARADGVGQPGDIVLTYIFWGPQIVWWSDYRVVAAPYGNGPALQDTRAFFTASTDEVAREIAVRRHVGLVLACAGEPENQLYDLQRSSLLSRLLGGEPPTWLTPVELPPSLAPAFRLYRLQDG